MRHRVNLEAKLDAYEASAAVGSSVAGKDRQRTWPVYAAAAGSGLAMATAAGADIIYSGPQNLSASIKGTGNSTNGVNINIDGKGNNFFLGVSNQKIGAFGVREAVAFLQGGAPHHSVLTPFTYQLANLAFGAKISRGGGAFGAVWTALCERVLWGGRAFRGWPSGVRWGQVHRGTRLHSLWLDPPVVELQKQWLSDRGEGHRLGVQHGCQRFDHRRRGDPDDCRAGAEHDGGDDPAGVRIRRSAGLAEEKAQGAAATDAGDGGEALN